MKTIPQPALSATLRTAWNHTTLPEPDRWNPSHPAQGQSVTVALLVQHLYGGTILRTQHEDGSHYHNLVAGKEIDLTRPYLTPSPEKKEPVPENRENLLADEKIRSAYENVLRRVSRFHPKWVE